MPEAKPQGDRKLPAKFLILLLFPWASALPPQSAPPPADAGRRRPDFSLPDAAGQASGSSPTGGKMVGALFLSQGRYAGLHDRGQELPRRAAALSPCGPKSSASASTMARPTRPSPPSTNCPFPCSPTWAAASLKALGHFRFRRLPLCQSATPSHRPQRAHRQDLPAGGRRPPRRGNSRRPEGPGRQLTGRPPGAEPGDIRLPASQGSYRLDGDIQLD